jgi:biotin carboxyl carrier protein
MLYKIKSQLFADAEAQLKGSKQILDDCTWSSCAAAVSWASGYTVDYSAADGVAAEKAALKRVDVQGKSDNGGSLAEAVKVIAHLGGKARYAKSWEDAVAAAKQGAALMVWVQQAVGYPTDVPMSKWHQVWKRWWTKTNPAHVKDGYGHMTSAGYSDGVWQWADPTMSGKDSEQYGVPVTEAQLRQIANSKVKAKKIAVDYKCLLIVTFPIKKAVEPVVTTVPAPQPAPTIAVQAPKSHAETRQISQATKTPAKPSVDQTAAISTLVGVVRRINASKGDQTMREQIIAAALDALQAALSTAIAVFLGLGVSIFDLTGDGFKAVAASAISAALLVLQRWLDEDNTAYGRQRK